MSPMSQDVEKNKFAARDRVIALLGPRALALCFALSSAHKDLVRPAPRCESAPRPTTSLFLIEARAQALSSRHDPPPLYCHDRPLSPHARALLQLDDLVGVTDPAWLNASARPPMPRCRHAVALLSDPPSPRSDSSNPQAVGGRVNHVKAQRPRCYNRRPYYVCYPHKAIFLF
ncbi:hypothetical protein BC834DRAFT_249700 [Gloeopeniophorella convolvens]|nr:hypothetical protein BC834DRAFT_249700 [Gloeopeniophorella convolvens]